MSQVRTIQWLVNLIIFDSSNGHSYQRRWASLSCGWMCQSDRQDRPQIQDTPMTEKSLRKPHVWSNASFTREFYQASPCHRRQAQGLSEVPNVTWKRFLRSEFFNAFSRRFTEWGRRLKTSQLPKFQRHLFGTFFGRNHMKSQGAQVARMDLSTLRPRITELLWSKNWSPFVVDLHPH